MYTLTRIARYGEIVIGFIILISRTAELVRKSSQKQLASTDTLAEYVSDAS